MSGVVGQKWRTSGYHCAMLAQGWRCCTGAAYLVHDVFQRVRAVDGEAYEEKIGLRVGQWSQSIILFLTSSVPEGELDCLASSSVWDLSDVVLEHGWYVFLQAWSALLLYPLDGRAHLGEVALRVADQKTGLATAAITHNDELLRVCWWLGNVGLFGHSRTAVDGARCSVACSRAWSSC